MRSEPEQQLYWKLRTEPIFNMYVGSFRKFIVEENKYNTYNRLVRQRDKFINVKRERTKFL